MFKEAPFRVVIVGGGIAGLTLANCLEQANIDYILLERRTEISGLQGASVSLEPNGFRILDQLGIADRVLQHTQATTLVYYRDRNGKLLAPPSQGIKLAGIIRSGYDLEFLDRQQLLDFLYDRIEDKSKILLGQKFTGIEQSANGIAALCQDGTSYFGHVLVGADGVASKTRSEMWKLASPSKGDIVTKDKANLNAEFKCLFGISRLVPGQIPGDFDWTYEKGHNCLVFAGPEGKAYYFMLEKLDRTYGIDEIPHYTQLDAKTFAEKYANSKIRPDVEFKQFFKNSTRYGLVALEEGKFDLWTFGRIACLGDSVHKMTPNLGTGANTAIESAAALTNGLMDMLEQSGGRIPDEATISKYLEGYHQKRKDRANGITEVAAVVTRLQIMDNLVYRFIANYCLPFFQASAANGLSDYLVGAEILNFLPPPKASLKGTMPFNPTQGVDKDESRIWRALLAVPFLALFYAAKSLMAPDPAVPGIVTIMRSGVISWNTGSVPVQYSFYQLEWLDKLWAPINVFFAPVIFGYDPTSRKQALSFITDYGVVLAIWGFESVRSANDRTLARWPLLFTLTGQFLGIGVVSSLYYFLSYITTPIDKFKAIDMRTTQYNKAIAILPIQIFAFILPFYAMLFWPSLNGRQSWLFVWQMSPVWIELLGFITSYFTTDTYISDKMYAPKRDIPVLRYTIGILSLFSASVWGWTVISSFSSLGDIFIPDQLPPYTSNLTDFIREFFKIDEIFLFTNTFLWLAYLFWDMKHAGMVNTSWIQIILLALFSTSIAGPGAAVGMGWLWREHIISNKRHKSAITEESLSLKAVNATKSKRQ